MSRRIVLIGATGFFGRRLAERLAGLPCVELVLTSRDEGRARQLAQVLAGSPTNVNCVPMAFERGAAPDVARLTALRPWLVIDASGPFQSASYDLARATLEMGAHWIDLADARDYILGFKAALDKPACDRGLVARCGASSTPSLSAAVVEDITLDWRRLGSVDIAILPGGAGAVGRAVIRAVLSYAGAEISTFNEGAPQNVIGWGSLRRIVVAGLGVRRVSPVETADADIMPERFGVTSRVSFHAGLESRLEQLGLVLLARLRQRSTIRSLAPMAGLLEKGRAVTRLVASDRGGMTIDCAGLDAEGRQVSARWTLIAEKGEGPDVPVLPTVALTRALLQGDIAPGAGPAVGVLKLQAIEAEMQGSAIATSRDVVRSPQHGVFSLACGEAAYAALPRALRAFHDADGATVWTGAADIDAPTNLVARLVRFVFGFPPAARDVPLAVTVDRLGASETWTRNFSGRRFVSQLTPVGGNRVAERFEPFDILLGIAARDGEISMPVVGWRIGPVPLPKRLAPRSETREFEDDKGLFRFDVAISLPMIGLIAHYRGWLAPNENVNAAADAGSRPIMPSVF